MEGLPMPAPQSASAFPHRQLRLLYPIEQIAAHNIAAAAEANAARSLFAPADEPPPEDEDMIMDGWGGMHRRPRETAEPGADIPCEVVRVEKRPWRAEATQQDEDAAEDDESKDPEAQPERSTAAPAAAASSLPAPSPLVATYANLYATTRLRQVRWFAHPNVLEIGTARPRSPTTDGSGSSSVPAQRAQPRLTRPMFESEGQVLVTVGPRSEWILSIAGFGRHGPSVEIFVRRRATDDEENAGAQTNGCWLSCSSTPDPARPLLDGAAADRPREGVYGLMAHALDARHVLVASGYRSGGYSRLTRRCFLLKLMDEEEGQAESAANLPSAAIASSSSAASSSAAASASPRPLLHLRWIPLPLSARLLPQPHCYGSLTIHHNPRSGLPARVLAFGGTNESGASNALSILDLSSMSWSAALASSMSGEQPPPPMHSHTAVVIDDAMWVCGGASGSDPPRSGRDHQEVFRLDLLSLTWTRMTSRISGARPTLDRRHRGHAVGRKIVFVGIDAATQKNKPRSLAAAAAAKAGTAAAAASSASVAASSSAAASSISTAAASSTAASAVPSPSESASKRARADESGAAPSAVAAPAASVSTLILDADDDEEEEDEEEEDEDDDVPALDDEDEEGENEDADSDPPLVRRRSPSSRGASYVSSVVVLDTEKLAWVWPLLQSPEHGPRFPRYASSSCVAGDEIFLFAGCMSSGHTQNDLHSLALNASLISAPQHASWFRARIDAETAMDAARVAPASHDDDYDDSEPDLLEEDDPMPAFLQQQADLLGAWRQLMLAGPTAAAGGANGGTQGGGGAGAVSQSPVAREAALRSLMRTLQRRMEARATGREEDDAGDDDDGAEANDDDEQDDEEQQ